MTIKSWAALDDRILDPVPPGVFRAYFLYDRIEGTTDTRVKRARDALDPERQAIFVTTEDFDDTLDTPEPVFIAKTRQGVPVAFAPGPMRLRIQESLLPPGDHWVAVLGLAILLLAIVLGIVR